MISPSNPDAQWFSALIANERGRFLALLIHGLTIGQRVLCSAGNAEGLRQLNEATHQVAGFLVDYHYGRQRDELQFFLFGLADEQARIQGMQAWNCAKERLAL